MLQKMGQLVLNVFIAIVLGIYAICYGLIQLPGFIVFVVKGYLYGID